MFNNIINRIGVALLLILLPFFAQAAFNDVTLDSDTVITTGGVTLNVTGSTASINSIVVGASDFTVTLNGTSSISVKSNDRYKINTTAAGRYVLTDCTGTAYTLTLTVPNGEAGEQVVTITPTTDICSGSTGSSGSRSGGGGGGGSSYVAPQPAPVVAPIQTPTPSTALDATLRIGDTGSKVVDIQSFLESKGFLKMPVGVAKGYFGPLTQRALEAYKAGANVSAPSVSATFKIGDRGASVVDIQNLLESKGFLVIPPGIAKGYFGPLTQRALEAYKAGANVSAPAGTPAPASTSSSSFSRALGKGSVGEDIRQLQRILNNDTATRIASDGVGSPGNETNMFGSLTEQAVGKFQIKYGIASPDDPGFGFVGPKTRAKLNELSK